MAALPRASASERRTLLPATPLVVFGALWMLVAILVTVVLAMGERTSMTSQIVGNVSILAALVFAAVTSIRAARRHTRARRAWIFMVVAMVLAAIGQANYVVAAFTGAQAAPSLGADIFALAGYALPLLAALFSFPRPVDRAISRYRQVLDVLVITTGTVLISEATVLRPVREVSDVSTIAGMLRLAYPLVDIAICAVVLCLGMRQHAGDRLTWLLVGGGTVLLSVTDSIYVRLLAEGQTQLTATPLVAGWLASPVLIGLATFIPRRRLAHGPDSTLAVQLVPYIPILGSMVVLGLGSAATEDKFIAISGVILLITVTIRQVMIVYENVVLTRDLEAKVAARTVELTTLGSIVTSSSDAIVGISLDNQVTAWNPAAERLFGREAAEVLGQPLAILPDQGEHSVRQLLRAARSGERLSAFELDWERPDGTVVPVAMTVSPIVNGTDVQGVSVSGQDISERRRAAAALEQAREDALESSRLKSEFLATMSHEIRTPMNGVIGLTTLLLETSLDEEQRRYAEGVRSAGEALLSVINDILDFSKLEAGKVLLESAEFDPRRLVEDVGALLAPAASAKGLELIAYCMPDVPSSVVGDAARVRQILLNLASNAVKFTEGGEVAIQAWSNPLGEDRILLHCEVKDTGIGVARKDQARLFQSFSQADASTTRRFGGTGLGLAICRRLIEAMGGEIGLQSEFGVGSTFWFTIPMHLGTASPIADAQVSEDLLKGVRVLVVDDNATNRTILQAQLRSWSMEVELVEDAVAGLRELRDRAQEGRPYDCAALDLLMPDIDGIDLARLIHEDALLRGTPLILLTSSVTVDYHAIHEAGIGQWLNKPIRSAELQDRFVRLLAPKEADLAARRRSDRADGAGAAGDAVSANEPSGSGDTRNGVSRDWASRNGASRNGASGNGASGNGTSHDAVAARVAGGSRAGTSGGADEAGSDEAGSDEVGSVAAHNSDAAVPPGAGAVGAAMVTNGRVGTNGHGGSDGPRGRILVVDANPLTRAIAERLVSQLGHPTTGVADAAAALESMEADPYAAVLIDCDLPGRDGFSVTREIRRREVADQHFPVIGLVDGYHIEAREAARVSGMDAVVARPLDGEIVAALLAERVAGEIDPLVPADGSGDGIDGIDGHESPIDSSRLADLAELVGADGTSLMHAFVTSFIGRSADRLAAINTAVAADDVETLGAAAHELRGAASMIGANRVAEVCKEIELAARRGETVDRSRVDRLTRELGTATNALQRLDLQQ